MTYSEDIEVVPVIKLLADQYPLITTMQSLPVGQSIKDAIKTNKEAEQVICFSKWLMPPQPQAYIKCAPYDFF